MRVDRAWKAIREQYFGKAQQVSREEGAGIALFRFLSHLRKGIFNCDFFYASKEDGDAYRQLLELSPYGKLIEDTYDPDTMFLVCVQIPNDDGDDTIGDIRVFRYDTFEEIQIAFE